MAMLICLLALKMVTPSRVRSQAGSLGLVGMMQSPLRMEVIRYMAAPGMMSSR